MSGLSVLTANIASKRERVPELLQAIDLTNPQVVVVTEAYYARKWLRTVAGYKLYQYTRRRGAEAPDIAVLVRADLRLVKRRPFRMTISWRGPGGRLHSPRVYPAMVLFDGRRRWPLMPVHFPSGGPAGPNVKAWHESWRRVSAWIEAREEAAGAGDWNATARELTDRLRGGLQLVVGTKVDHAVSHGLHHATTERLTRLQPEGMHGWVLYKLQGR